MVSREEELMDALDKDFPESWVPETVGDKLVGRFVRIDEGPSDYGPVPIYVFDVDGKEYGAWAFHAVLRSQMEAAKPKPGDLIGISYKGEKQGAKQTYKNYRVINMDKVVEAPPPVEFAPASDASDVDPEDAQAPSPDSVEDWKV